MSGHSQSLRQLLKKETLTALEVRDGLIAAYCLVTSLNQSRGNTGVGLKQEGEALAKHISGFMEAIFWERGYAFDDPSLANLSDIKMMMDGMTQIYAMPEHLQTAVSEFCDALMAKAGSGGAGQPSPETLGLLETKGKPEAAPAEEIPDYMHPIDETDFHLPLDASQPPSAAVLEDAWPPEPAVAGTPARPPAQEPASMLEAEPSRASTEDVIPAPQDFPHPAPANWSFDSLGAPPSMDAFASSDAADAGARAEALPQVGEEAPWMPVMTEAAAPSPDAIIPAAGTESNIVQPDWNQGKAGTVKKTRKKTSSANAPAAAKKTAKRAPRKQKQIKIDLSSIPAPVLAAEVPEVAGLEPASEPAAAPENEAFISAPDFTEPVLEVPVSPAPVFAETQTLANEVFEESLEDAAPEVQGEPVLSPATDVRAIEEMAGAIDAAVEDSPSSLDELAMAVPAPASAESSLVEEIPADAVHAEEDRPVQVEKVSFLKETPQPDFGLPETDRTLDSERTPPPTRNPWLAVFLFLLGAILAGAGTYYWFGVRAGQHYLTEIDGLKSQLKTAESSLIAARDEVEALKGKITMDQKATEVRPDKPAYLKQGKGIFLYWPVGPAVRKFNVYRGKESGEPVKLNDMPIMANYYPIKEVAKGSWRFSVAAVDWQGQETEKGEALTLKFPLKK